MRLTPVQQIRNRFKKLYKKASKLYPDLEIYGQPDLLIKHHTEMNSDAAYADFDNYSIEINSFFLEKYTQEILDEILPHELAHIICDLKYPGYGKTVRIHGKEFREICQFLGARGDTYHEFDHSEIIGDLTGKREKRHLFLPRCGCEIWVSTRIKNKIIKEGDVRMCVKHGKRFDKKRYTGQER